jgi:hypothetical protein
MSMQTLEVRRKKKTAGRCLYSETREQRAVDSLAYSRAAIRRGMECRREDDENNSDEEEQRKPWVPAAGSVIHGA